MTANEKKIYKTTAAIDREREIYTLGAVIAASAFCVFNCRVVEVVVLVQIHALSRRPFAQPPWPYCIIKAEHFFSSFFLQINPIAVIMEVNTVQHYLYVAFSLCQNQCIFGF